MPKMYADLRNSPATRNLEGPFYLALPTQPEEHGTSLREILLFFTDAVVVGGCYCDDMDEQIIATDLDGNTFLKVTVYPNTEVYDEAEAGSILACVEADMCLLSYAL
jgi:hypothetical protein